MKTFQVTAVISLFTGYLWAQAQQTDQFNIKTNETTWKGTLVDSCRSSYNDSQKSSRNTNRDTSTTKNLKNQFTSNATSYPGTTPTVLMYGLITEDGKCIPFDQDSSEKISGLMKMKKDWSENTVKINPTKVEVVGTENDNTIAVDEIKIK